MLKGFYYEQRARHRELPVNPRHPSARDRLASWQKVDAFQMLASRPAQIVVHWPSMPSV
jgi:hypothetical protein